MPNGQRGARSLLCSSEWDDFAARLAGQYRRSGVTGKCPTARRGDKYDESGSGRVHRRRRNLRRWTLARIPAPCPDVAARSSRVVAALRSDWQDVHEIAQQRHFAQGLCGRGRLCASPHRRIKLAAPLFHRPGQGIRPARDRAMSGAVSFGADCKISHQQRHRSNYCEETPFNEQRIRRGIFLCQWPSHPGFRLLAERVPAA